MSDEPFLARAIEILTRHQGIGGRSAGWPAWQKARLLGGMHGVSQATGRSLSELVTSLEDDAELRAELAELLRVGETRFFRDPAQWSALRSALLPSLHGPRLRALSAGCSTGEEAWTLSMLLDEAARGRPFRVVGLDRSRAALAVARDGVYAIESTRDLPRELCDAYLQASADGATQVHPRLKSAVSFVARDLLQGTTPGEFELIVCKNVLIYLAVEAQQRVLRLLASALAPGGALVVARSEVPRARGAGLRADELAAGITVFRCE